jgi:hypothetical protein
MAEEADKHSRKINQRKRIELKDVKMHLDEGACGAFSWLSSAISRNPDLRHGDAWLPATNYADGCGDSMQDFLRNYFIIAESVRRSSDEEANRALDKVESALRRDGGLTLEMRQRKRSAGD